MLATIIIPTYNQIDYLYETLDSVFMQKHPEIEIIIADDGSTKFPKDAINDYIIAHKNDNIVSYTILIQEKNLGIVRNMNSAIAIAKGEIIMPLASDDCLFDADVVGNIVAIFIKRGCKVLTCSRMKYTQDMEKRIRIMPHPVYRKLFDKYMDTAKNQYKFMGLGRLYEYASGSAIYYRKDYISKFKGYDERYVLWEDGPFISRTAGDGVKIESEFDLVTIKYRDGGISSKNRKVPNTIYYDYCNLAKFEFFPNKSKFTKREQRILDGLYELQKNYNQISLPLALKYPEAVLYMLPNKFLKAWILLTGKLNIQTGTDYTSY